MARMARMPNVQHSTCLHPLLLLVHVVMRYFFDVRGVRRVARPN